MIFTQFNNDSDNLSLLITQNTSARYVKIMMDILDLNGGFGYRVRPMGNGHWLDEIYCYQIFAVSKRREYEHIRLKRIQSRNEFHVQIEKIGKILDFFKIFLVFVLSKWKANLITHFREIQWKYYIELSELIHEHQDGHSPDGIPPQ